MSCPYPKRQSSSQAAKPSRPTRGGRFPKEILVAVTAVFFLLPATTIRAATHPCMMLNKTEISSIKAKVQAGEQPWKDAFTDVKRRADEASGKTFYLPLGYGHVWLSGSAQSSAEQKNNYSYDYLRHVASDFGFYLINAAMVYHITGEAKYADWIRRNINSWFFDPKTYMEPRGATVGLNNSFLPVVYGVDLSWEIMTPEMRTKMKDWMVKFHASVASKPDGTIGGAHNRGDWWVAMLVASGLVAENTSIMSKGVQHWKLRPVKESGQLNGVGGSTDGSMEKEVSYNYFAVNALVDLVEMGRHNGVDLHSILPINGKSKFERMCDFYATWAFKYEKATGGNIAFYEVANAYKQKDTYLNIVNRIKRPINLINAPNDIHCTFKPITLTHARGAYPLSIYNSDGQRTGTIGGATPVARKITMARSARSPSLSIASGLRSSGLLISHGTSSYTLQGNRRHTTSSRNAVAYQTPTGRK